jgi:ElaB/YqjD/DUF883 family membrane-anchored ribosome-binding protein
METTGQNQSFADQAGNKISNTVENLRGGATATIDKVAGKAQAMAKQSTEAVGNATQQVRERAAGVSDGIIAYTKENPIKALLFAGAAGALIATVRRR